jgi:hypothetical protein
LSRCLKQGWILQEHTGFFFKRLNLKKALETPEDTAGTLLWLHSEIKFVLGKLEMNTLGFWF